MNNPITGPGKYITRSGVVVTLTKFENEPEWLVSDQKPPYAYSTTESGGHYVLGANRTDPMDIISKHQPEPNEETK